MKSFCRRYGSITVPAGNTEWTYRQTETARSDIVSVIRCLFDRSCLYKSLRNGLEPIRSDNTGFGKSSRRFRRDSTANCQLSDNMLFRIRGIGSIGLFSFPHSISVMVLSPQIIPNIDLIFGRCLVGRPGEFHPQPPIEPYVKLSLHTAPRFPHLLLRFPVAWLSVHVWFHFSGSTFPPFAPSVFTDFLATAASSAPALRHLYYQPRCVFPPACAFRLTYASRFPSFAVKAHAKFLPPIHRSLHGQ